MDKKYKAIKTIKELDLSRGARSSLSSISGKSDFSTQSQEDKFNKAYAKDFSITPPKTPLKKDKLLPPKLRPRKLLPVKTKTETKTETKPETKPKDIIKNKRLPNLYQEWLNGEWEIGFIVSDKKTDRFNIDKVKRNLLTHIKDEKLKEWVKKAVKDIKKDWKKTDPETKEALGHFLVFLNLDYFKKNQDWEGNPLKN